MGKERYSFHFPASVVLALLEQGNSFQAERYLERLVARGVGRSAWELADLARCLDLLGRTEQALEKYQEAVHLNHGVWLAWLGLAALERRLGRGGPADQNYARALDELAREPWLQGSYIGGVLDRLLLDQLQEEPQLRTNAGSCYRLGVETAYYDRAIQAMEVYSQGLAIQPDHFWCRFGLGRIQAKQGRLAEARTALAAAATLAPADPYLLWDFTQDLVSVGLPDRAVGSAQTLVGLDPNYWGNWQLLSKALLASGKPDAAVEALRSAVAHSPISLSPDVQLGDLLRELGRTEEAALVYQAMSTRGDRGKSRANRDLLRIAASRLTGLGVRRS